MAPWTTGRKKTLMIKVISSLGRFLKALFCTPLEPGAMLALSSRMASNTSVGTLVVEPVQIFTPGRGSFLTIDKSVSHSRVKRSTRTKRKTTGTLIAGWSNLPIGGSVCIIFLHNMFLSSS